MVENTPEKTTKGLIFHISNMNHHYTSGIRSFLCASLTDPKAIEKSFREIYARTRGLEADLTTMRGAIGKILTLVEKKRGYEDIRKVIEEEMYPDGFEHRYDKKVCF